MHLLIPSLFCPPASLTDPAQVQAPGLQRLLDRARPLPGVEGYFPQLLQLVGQPLDTPAAPIALLGEGLIPGDGIWMQASPVHLRADLANLLLFADRDLPIQTTEAESLCTAFNAHFGGQGLALTAPHAQRWYLRLNTMPRLRTWPLEQVVGGSPQPFLPQGADAHHWRALLTETQMLFHGQELNQQRQMQGLPAINGLWLHGAGRLPRPAPCPISALMGEDLLARGVQRWLGLGQGAETAGDGELRLFLALAQARSAAHWLEALQRLEAWLEPHLAWLQADRQRRLRLYDGGGRGLECSPRRGLRLWPRPRPFGDYLR
ncbi:MAG: hypothetical protein H7842_04835 [Gammaproteobacteria bacterium SHHR-1]